MQTIKDSLLKQIVFLLLITFLGIVLVYNLRYFISGALGAITLYILLRQFYFKLTIIYKWKKWLAAVAMIVMCVVVFILPVWGLVELILPKIKFIMSNSTDLIAQAKHAVDQVRKIAPWINISHDDIQRVIQKVLSIFPTFLNAAGSVLINTLVALFILYFMLIGGRDLERNIIKFLPLKDENTDSLWLETRNMVVSNAIGIPVLILCQCILAALGYWIFGAQNPILWGLLTGVASLIPMVGTMIIWIPICAIMIGSGDVGMGVGLLLYCAIVVSNIDNVLRFTILKRIGDVHPLITVFGVLVGLQLFGMMGLIFGPLLLTYFILIIKMYRLEFSGKVSETT